ncbi:hypothetical protein JMJ77_0002333 [Colletotrichum scovillei]|uniref:Uncharacterized protein n=1 Tax=Colletotrichum scovillei TaxID=1209932 RepID=A0A9P7RAH7_9PEZI|nr:hypothetical protein JMJ77_0002333 [Colletotrichum scovillei]KAG7070753.1 hypothetical protein JMJ76_0001999 [Colletotrichum scovillei]KAG7079021.1 hypothetical protein JMJ78_0002683 [Colletotrichum scovillei]
MRHLSRVAGTGLVEAGRAGVVWFQHLGSPTSHKKARNLSINLVYDKEQQQQNLICQRIG